MSRTCLIGLDENEVSLIRSSVPDQLLVHEVLPRLVLKDGSLFATMPDGIGMCPISKVVFHGIFENDHDVISGLALWDGPCLPNARAMMDCRLKLPCLVRALRYTRFGSSLRGYVSAGLEFESSSERVAKWGNWHCGENKHRFTGAWTAAHNAIVEPFIVGQAVRIVLVGDRYWQIKLEGKSWLKSIHHESAALMEVDDDLLADTRQVASGFGLEIMANDYIVDQQGVPHLLEVNHIPNVTRFEEIREAYLDYVANWLAE